jgi:hypothetical protein
MSKRRTHSPEYKARVAMDAISGRKTIREIAADHAIDLHNAPYLSVRPDPGQPVEEAAAGGRKRAAHQGQEEQGQGGGVGCPVSTT